jgi:Uma2 family endonuclease
MATKPKNNMTVEEYLKEYEGSPAGRYELVGGEVITMSAESAAHARVKGKIHVTLTSAIAKKGLDCEAFPDGMTIKINGNTAREPDAAVQCGERVKPNSMLLDRPLIVFEVISPSSKRDDTQKKLVEYFSIPSIQHYVIVDPETKVILHHQRNTGEKILTSIIRTGEIEFKPPGFSIAVSDIIGTF